MNTADARHFRDGGGQALAALAVATVTATVIATANWAGDDIAGRLAIAGVVLFGLGLAIGSASVVGAASIPVLGSALIASATADNPAWVRSIVLGCLWYVAVELAWDAIERRSDGQRSSALDLRRINEVSTVVVVSLVVTASAYAASSLDAPRTLLRQAVIVIALLAALVIAIRHILATAPPAADDRN